MARTRADRKVRSEEPTAYDTLFDTKQAFVNKQIAAEWLDIQKHAAWYGGYVLDQVVVKRNKDGWLLIFKASRRGRVYAAFVQAATPAEAFEFGGELAAKGQLTWEHDKWPSRWLKDTLGIK